MDMQGFYSAACLREYATGMEQGIAQGVAPTVPFCPGMNNLPASGSPWNSRGLAWGMQSPPELVQFTGSAYLKDKHAPTVLCTNCKRKSLDEIPAVPAKQLITEEKMAAHLNSLHLSHDFTSHSSAESMDVMMDGRDGEALAGKVKGTIKLSDEVKRIREEPILPAVLIERLEKPTMSLVVWQPRENIIEQAKKPKAEEEEQKTRKGVLVSNCSNDVDMWSSGPDDWSASGNGSCM